MIAKIKLFMDTHQRKCIRVKDLRALLIVVVYVENGGKIGRS